MNQRINPLCQMLKIKFPIILAPMFLVSNEAMIISGCNAGITGAIPALNYRNPNELREGIRKIKAATTKPFGINLIVNKSNYLLKEQLNICCEEQVAFLITSLGSPELVLHQAQHSGIKVFCDVINLDTALKVEQLGCDAIIAVNNLAGGHAGSLSPEQFIPELKKYCQVPIISAGGVGNAETLRQIMNLGADATSIGSIFIASNEASISTEYKQAIVDYGAKDIVMTSKLSGTPCTVIKTPYLEHIGADQNLLEKLLNKNKILKKWIKLLTFYHGMKRLREAAFSATYKNIWCAGPSIEHVQRIRPVAEIVAELCSIFRDSGETTPVD